MYIESKFMEQKTPENFQEAKHFIENVSFILLKLNWQVILNANKLTSC